MKLAISSIAWQPAEDRQIAALLQELGVRGVEIAPTLLSPEPLALSPAELRQVRSFWADHGIAIIALQSLLFGQPQLNLFGVEKERRQMFDYLRGMIALGGALGASVLVFGSPRNRRAAGLAQEAAMDLAVGFFRDLAVSAMAHNICFCIEPNAPVYGCDFITDTTEALTLVERVNHPGFGLHLDAGVMTLNGEPVTALRAAYPHLRHFHISEPHLGRVSEDRSGHLAWGAELQAMGYGGWASIEMRGGQGTSNLVDAREALHHAFACYGY